MRVMVPAAQWQTSSPGQKWAASLVVSRVRAAGIEEDEKDMRKRVTRGRPDAKAKKLMAASSTAQPPGVVKTLTDDTKRKRPVKKRRAMRRWGEQSAQAAVRASRPEMQAPLAEMRVGEAEMGHRHGKMWPRGSHQRHPKAPGGLTWLRVSA
eukprot:jgi/Tetstr1/464736/TSEL_009483.t1